WDAPLPPPAPPAPRAPPSKPSAPAPTIALEASPSTITSGQASTLKWNSTDATSVTIDGGLGTVEGGGSRQRCPPRVASVASHPQAAKSSGAGSRRKSRRRGYGD